MLRTSSATAGHDSPLWACATVRHRSSDGAAVLRGPMLLSLLLAAFVLLALSPTAPVWAMALLGILLGLGAVARLVRTGVL